MLAVNTTCCFSQHMYIIIILSGNRFIDCNPDLNSYLQPTFLHAPLLLHFSGITPHTIKSCDLSIILFLFHYQSQNKYRIFFCFCTNSSLYGTCFPFKWSRYRLIPFFLCAVAPGFLRILACIIDVYCIVFIADNMDWEKRGTFSSSLLTFIQ